MKTATSPSPRRLILAAATLIASLASVPSRAAELRVGGGDRQHHARPAGRAPGPDAHPHLQGRPEPGDGDRAGPGVEGRRPGARSRPSSSRATWWRSTGRVLDRARALLKDRLPGLRRPEARGQRHAHAHRAGLRGGAIPDPQGRRHAAGGIRRVPRRADRRGGGGRLGVAQGRAASAGGSGTPWSPRTGARSTPTAGP